MNTLIITCLLSAEQSAATFGADPVLDIFYLPKDTILELYDTGVYLFPICYDPPKKMTEEQVEKITMDLFKGDLLDFQDLFAGEKADKEQSATVIILVEVSDFEALVDIFHDNIKLPDAEWNIKIIDATEDLSFMPYDLCVAPVDVFETQSEIFEMYLCPFGEFVSGIVHEDRTKSEIKKMLSDKQIQKRRASKKKKTDKRTRFNNAKVEKTILNVKPEAGN